MRTIQIGIERKKDLYLIVDDCDYERFDLANKSIYVRRQRDNYYTYFKDDNGKNIMIHRLITGATKRSEICDHLNGNTLDCRRENLRITDNKNNALNHKKYMSNKSGYNGVSEIKCVIRFFPAPIPENIRQVIPAIIRHPFRSLTGSFNEVFRNQVPNSRNPAI